MKQLIFMILLAFSFCSLNAQIEKNDSIKSKTEKKEFIDSYYGPQPYLRQSPTTPGDYIIKSARLKLAGIGLGFSTSILVATGAIDFPGDGFAVWCGLTSLGLYIGGEVCLIKAGKLMNKEQVYLSPASEGIGLGINF